METVVLEINKNKFKISILQKAIKILKNGGVISFPTDTVYALASNAFITDARKKIYKLKGRSFSKPLILMASNIQSLKHVVEFPKEAEKLADKFWPGPLTLVLKTTVLGKVLMGGRENLGVRIPDDKLALKLLKLCGFPLLTTSANASSKTSAVLANDVKRYFNGKIEAILDAGSCKISKESMVLDMTHFPFTIIRHGCLEKEKILKYL
jgi:L-threonylcarbamoyladenylate synthase